MLLWLQGLFLFSLIWGLAGTITGDSRKKFDTFLRDFLTGSMEEYPKPKSIKFSKVEIEIVLIADMLVVFFFRRISFPNAIPASISTLKRKQPAIGVIGPTWSPEKI